MNTKEWLAKLIAFDSTSKQSNVLLINELAEWLKRHEVNCHIISGPDNKANLFATIPAQGNQEQGGIILSGHTDTVPVMGQIWDSDPFVAIERDGKIYGRGACDMKGFLAVVLGLLPEFKKLKLQKPIHLAFTADEEIGCLGAPFLLDYIKKLGIQPEACIVGEPSSMLPIVGYKGRQVFHCQVKGYAAHSSLTNRGCNAIVYASRLITYIHAIAEKLKNDGPFDNDFDLPYTSLTTNIISGGQANNIIPNNCEFIFEMRYLPEFSVETIRSQIENYINTELLPDMRQTYPKAEVYLDLISSAPAFSAHENEGIASILRVITGVKRRFKVSYSTEAALFQRAHIPTIICGPGNIEQAHQANEFITLDQLDICEKVIRNIINFFCLAPKINES